LLTAENLGLLFHRGVDAVAVGEVKWVRQGVRCTGIVAVKVSVGPLAPCELRMIINRLEPSEPTMTFLVAEGRDRFSARRLCVNKPHRPYPGTHKHRPPPGGGEEAAYEPDDIPELPLQPRVAPGAYRAILEAFAAECLISMGSDFVWTEPP
jgi:hypothetical protein